MRAIFPPPTNDSWRVDETYIRVKGKWVYLYRAVDSSGATIDFLLSDLNIHGVSVGPHRVLRGESAAVANAIAGFLLYLRDDKGKVPHAYFNWTEGNPLLYLLHYVLSGEGDVAPVTREVLRKAEPNAQRRPAIHAGI